MSTILVAVEDVSSSGSGSYPGTYINHVIIPYDRPFTVSAGGGTVTVTYNVDFSVFPLQYVDYVDSSGNAVRINGIDAMDKLPGPDKAPHVFKMREDTKSFVDFTLIVNSFDIETDEEGNSNTINYSTSYNIRINANYNTNRDKLVAAINLRR